MERSTKAFLATILAVALAFSSTISTYAASPAGYLDLPNSVISGGTGIKSGSWGTFNLPGKGNVTIDYENVQVASDPFHMDPAPTFQFKPEFLALGYNNSLGYVPTIYQQDANVADGTVIYTFERSWKDFSILLFDVDNSDDVTITAYDQNGTLITDFSGWTLAAEGDSSVSNADGGTDPAPPPTWNPTTGHLISSDPTNTHRTFTELRPDVALSSLRIHLAAPGTGAHIYSALYSHSTPELSIGNKVWLDTNNNGIHDLGETGIQNAVIELLDSGGNVIATTTTDSLGNYLFDNLPEGRYAVRIAASNFQSGSVLEGYRSSLYGTEPVQPDNARVNNQDRGTEGAILASDGITSPWYDLFYDSEPDDDDDTLRSTNLTVDLGLVAVNVPGDGGSPLNPSEPNQPVQNIPDAPDAGVGASGVSGGFVALGSLLLITALSVVGRRIYLKQR